MTEVLYRGDTAPDLEVTVVGTVNGARGPVPFHQAQSIRAIGRKDGLPLFDRQVTGNSSGVIVMPWEAGDTATTGLIEGELEVTWSPGRIQTFRLPLIEVLPDLG